MKFSFSLFLFGNQVYGSYIRLGNGWTFGKKSQNSGKVSFRVNNHNGAPIDAGTDWNFRAKSNNTGEIDFNISNEDNKGIDDNVFQWKVMQSCLDPKCNLMSGKCDSICGKDGFCCSEYAKLSGECPKDAIEAVKNDKTKETGFYCVQKVNVKMPLKTENTSSSEKIVKNTKWQWKVMDSCQNSECNPMSGKCAPLCGEDGFCCSEYAKLSKNCPKDAIEAMKNDKAKKTVFHCVKQIFEDDESILTMDYPTTTESPTWTDGYDY